MERQYLNELDEGGTVEGAFLLRSKELRAARTGDAYLSLQIADKTASMGAVYFRPTLVATEIPVGSVVEVRGIVSTYRGVRRVSVDSLKPASQWSPADLIASGVRSHDEMVNELRRIVGSIEAAPFRKLVRSFFADKQFRAEYERCPGSIESHHAYLGGLMEHSLSVASQCILIAGAHSSIDRDLLVTAALLHDIGRTVELTCHTGIDSTHAGRLLGHVTPGAQLVHERGRAVHMDATSLELLEHVVLTHHDGRSSQSEPRPATLEALTLHHVDSMDIAIAAFEQVLTGATSVGEDWTDAANTFGRRLYTPTVVNPAAAPQGERSGPYLRTA